jgi:hypothetical protein
VRSIPFDEVEGIQVETLDDGQAVSLRLAGDAVWPVEAGLAPADAQRLVAALRGVGGWPVVRPPEMAPR